MIIKITVLQMSRISLAFFIIPDGGNYSEGWHLYFHRKIYSDVFQELKANKIIDIMVSAEIPSNIYKKNQGNMALVRAMIR